MPKKRRNQKRRPQRKHSTIPEHKRQGKKLIPPLRQIVKREEPRSSWMNERLPEMLWAILLVTHLPRDQALHIFRRVAKYIQALPETDRFHDVTHTGLSRLPSGHLNGVLSIITEQSEQKEVLASLLLLEELPVHAAWAKALGVDQVSDDWEPLMSAVAETLWHQTQASTDCRWLTVFCSLVAERFGLALEKRDESVERVKEIYCYPSYGDQNMVAASIRSREIFLSGMLNDTDPECSEWAAKFWDQCLTKTPCFRFDADSTMEELSVGMTVARLGEVYNLLTEHTYGTQTTSGVDARHDTVFGVGLYCLGLLQELLRVGNCNAISARATLRTIAECYITLTYLAKKDDANLWLTHRSHGAGQAKLAFLKLDEASDVPRYVDVQTLEALASEDRWQEFLEIDLGHWDKTDLRKMSIAADVKDVYDQFYDWTSAFAHGNWAAIRNAVFDTCGNPLHRLHRIPRQSIRALPDVIPDACQLVDKVLEIVSQLYPDFPHRVSVPQASGF